jgi:hypothetical protein
VCKKSRIDSNKERFKGLSTIQLLGEKNMQKDIAPKTILGKWSVGLNAFFLIVVITSIVLVKVLGILSFDDHWWDVTVPIVFLASIVALFTGIISIRKNKESSILVYLSIFISICVVFFIFFHSLFISD